MYELNANAGRICQSLLARAQRLRIELIEDNARSRRFDFGINAPGGLEAGCLLAEVCMAGLGQVDLIAAESSLWPGPAIAVWTDHPVAACMASQYAGWQITGDGYFAMGSGPMRAAAGREPLYDAIGYRERPQLAVGVLESRRLPPESICFELAAACGVAPEQLTLLVAPTASLAGTIQIVARSVETALHKMLELGFDLHRVASGFGTAPLPPVADDDLVAIGRANDAVLYGGQVTLWVRGDDDSLREIAERIPSSASPDYGQPFARIFQQYDRDFYKIDPLLFSPAQVALINLDTGQMVRAGETRPDVLRQSFEG